MSDTIHLKLPLLAAAQAQKHVTHNEALLHLDALVHLSVNDRDLTSPPVSPSDGDRYLVASGATGGWAGEDGKIALADGTAWLFLAPAEGWRIWVSDEDLFLVFDGTSWVHVTVDRVQNASLVGVNATADATNKLSVASPAVLFSHDGAGMQHKINKNAAGDTASLLFQTGFSGRAEFGLTGDDDFRIKVSADGTSFQEALHADRATGSVRFPGGQVASSHDLGTLASGTLTPDPADGNRQHGTNGGAFTLAAPAAAGDYDIVLQLSNNAAAGTVTPSGFSTSDLSALTTTDGDDFFIHIRKHNGFTTAVAEALQ